METSHGHVIVHTPGSLRRLAHWGEPNKLWGTVEDQIADATAENAAQWSSLDHKPMPLYTMRDDCPHTNPEDDERFDGIDDGIDEWLASMGVARNEKLWHLWWINYQRAYTVIPLAGEYAVAQRQYDNAHSGSVCLDSYAGSACSNSDCHDGDEDYGIEPGVCRIQERAREAWDEFWWAVEADQ